jgi:4-carboxymuconolactone decarboxylase
MIAERDDGQRLGPLEPPYAADVQRTLERLMGGVDVDPLRLFRTIAHNQVLLDKLRSTGSYLLNFGTIDALEREIVILRTCARCECEYEWGVHVSIFSSAVELTEDQVRATVTDDRAPWSDRQRALIDLVDELHDTSMVSDDLWTRLADGWRPDQLVELVTLVGQYHTVSFTANALGVRLEDFGARFPS